VYLYVGSMARDGVRPPLEGRTVRRLDFFVEDKGSLCRCQPSETIRASAMCDVRKLVSQGMLEPLCSAPA
jgi:hypothetical protein